MKVFIDECIDWRLSRDLPGHQISTARQMGWAGLRNGELLALAAAQFDVFVTSDRNLVFQQNVTAFDIAVIVLQATRNRLFDLKPLIPKLLVAVETAERGSVTVISIQK